MNALGVGNPSNEWERKKLENACLMCWLKCNFTLLLIWKRMLTLKKLWGLLKLESLIHHSIILACPYDSHSLIFITLLFKFVFLLNENPKSLIFLFLFLFCITSLGFVHNFWIINLGNGVIAKIKTKTERILHELKILNLC